MSEVTSFEITNIEKETIKMRLFYTFFYYEDKVKLDENYTIDMVKKYDEYIKQYGKENIDNEENEFWKVILIEQMNEIKYRILLNNISLIYEMFEQFLISILIEKLNLKKGMYFRVAKERFREYGFNLEKSNYWNKIYELQTLVNVIKHGDGDAKDKLQKVRKDFFTPQKSMIKNSINDMTLNVNESDLEDYCINVIKFIDDMPNKFKKEE